MPRKEEETYGEGHANGNATVVSDGYDSADVLVVAVSESNESWVLDSGCSFHMYPKRKWFRDLVEEETGTSGE